jgi:hypothetical protein
MVMAQEALIESPEVPYLTLLRVNPILHSLSNLSMKKTRSKTNENDEFDIRKQRNTKNPLLHRNRLLESLDFIRYAFQ